MKNDGGGVGWSIRASMLKLKNMKNYKKYLNSCKSLHLYPKTKDCFLSVFKKIPEEQLTYILDGLELMVIHQGAVAQVMRFQKYTIKKVLQLSIPANCPKDVLQYIIAHELGHVLQGRN